MKPITASHHVIVAGVAAALLSSAALTGCSPRQADAAPAGAPASIAVTTAPVAMTDVASAIDAGGVVQARTTATITARILAPVREVRVSPGDQRPAGPDAHRARQRRSRRRRPCRALSSPCRRTGVEGGRSRAPGRGGWPGPRTRVPRSHRRPAGQAVRHRAGARRRHGDAAGRRGACRRCVRAGLAGRVGSPERPGRRRPGEHHRTPSRRLPRPSTA